MTVNGEDGEIQVFYYNTLINKDFKCCWLAEAIGRLAKVMDILQARGVPE